MVNSWGCRSFWATGPAATRSRGDTKPDDIKPEDTQPEDARRPLTLKEQLNGDGWRMPKFTVENVVRAEFSSLTGHHGWKWLSNRFGQVAEVRLRCMTALCALCAGVPCASGLLSVHYASSQLIQVQTHPQAQLASMHCSAASCTLPGRYT